MPKVPIVPEQIFNNKKGNNMARFETSVGIEDVVGKFDKKSRITMRRKAWKSPDGKSIFGYGPKEMYGQDPRDYKKNPRTPAEQVQYEKWKAVCLSGHSS